MSLACEQGRKRSLAKDLFSSLPAHREHNVSALHRQLSHVGDLDEHLGLGRNVAHADREDIRLFLFGLHEVAGKDRKG